MKKSASRRCDWYPTWVKGLCTTLLCTGLLLGGCKNLNQEAQQPAQEKTRADAVAAAVRDQAQRLEALRLAQAKEAPPVVLWLNESDLKRPQSPDSKTDKPVTAVKIEPAQEAKVEVKSAANVSVEPVKASAQPVLTLDKASRDELLAQLLLTERQNNTGSPMLRVVNIASLLGMSGKAAFDPRDLQTISDPQRVRAQHYFQLMTLLREQVLSPGGVPHDGVIMDHLDGLMNDVPLHIRKVALTRSVSSFGVYDPMESNTFLTGRPQPMIVYVELEHYKAVKDNAGKFAVKLAQELVLYNAADGLAVWREPKVQITDESLNHRRDFFVVQRIELPARLGVGKYLLKLTMTDLQGGSIDETSIPIQIVADATLVKKD